MLFAMRSVWLVAESEPEGVIETEDLVKMIQVKKVREFKDSSERRMRRELRKNRKKSDRIMSYQVNFIMKCSNSFSAWRPEKKDGFFLPSSYAQAIIKNYTTVDKRQLKCAEISYCAKILQKKTRFQKKKENPSWHRARSWAPVNYRLLFSAKPHA